MFSTRTKVFIGLTSLFRRESLTFSDLPTDGATTARSLTRQYPPLTNFSRITSYRDKPKTSEQLCRKCLRQYTARAELATEPKSWKLLSLVCLQRHPVITKPLTEVDGRYKKYLETLEIERSYLSDFELQKAMESNKKRKEVKGKKTKEKTDASILTSEDKLRLWKAELEAFIPASRTTVADEENDAKSVKRCLDQSLFLIIQNHENGTRSNWRIPFAGWEQGETMRETAERALSHCCGDAINAQIIGNAPVSFFKYVLPPSVQEAENVYGAKAFLFKAVYMYNKGEINLDKNNVLDYKWVTKSELKKHVRSDLYSAINKSLLD